MQVQKEHPPLANGTVQRANARVVMLDEVNFKWLLAGLGWWIDMSRFHCDPSYATRYLKLAEASDSPALRDCAASLQSHSDLTCP